MRIRFFQSLFQLVRPQGSSKLTDVQKAEVKSGVGSVKDSFESPPGRNKFYSGKLLTETDFRQEQNYNRDKGSDTEIAFPSGDVNHPYLTGFLWNSENRPPVVDDGSDDSDKDDP